MKIPERLRRYLAERDALQRFERNVARQRGQRITPTNIETAFAWDLTPEGFDYWNDMAEGYNRYVADQIINEVFYGDDSGRAG